MQLNRPGQAMLIWPVLVLAARMQRVLTYGELHDFTGVIAVSQAFPLHLIYLYCKGKGYPLLNAIVVSQETGFPSDEFPEKMTPARFLEERARVFTFNWSAKDKPRAEDLEGLHSATA
jgi:hypothetical protein